MIISHLFLQQYWWIIISFLASFLVFLMFVQGGQSMIFSLPGNEVQRTMMVNALGRKWEFTFTTLVTFGGAFFASFPLFYATSFGGAYWVWIAILFSFIIQAVAYEYRSKPANVYGQRTFDVFLFINGSVGPFLIGVAVATFFTGAMFSLNQFNQVKWATPWHGLEALLNVRNLSLGIAVLFLARVNGLLYLINALGDKDLVAGARKRVPVNAVIFIISYLFFIVSLLASAGYAIDSASGAIVSEKFKYLNNFLAMPVVSLMFVAGVAGVIYGIVSTASGRGTGGIWYCGSGTVFTVLSLFMVAGFNSTPYYPSSFDPASSLTLMNSSSSLFTLKTMMYVSFIIPFVIAYIWYAWKAINVTKITREEMGKEGHVY